MNPNITERIIRESERFSITGISKTTCWGLEKDGLFPKRISLGPRSVGWKLSEIMDWIESRPTA